MKTYEVTIKATVTKTYEVRALDEESAESMANDMFDVSYERGIPDKYEQDTIEIKETN